MTFVSYAQNYEDVILYRALKNVKKGFYVDVGANDPIIASVTKAFYERGWRGINIEPIRNWYDKLLVDRPEDTNLNIAISNQPGVMHFYDIQDTGLSTSDKQLAEKHSKELGFQYKEIVVPTLTLDNVLKDIDREIHFLKVDVEGAEKQILTSIDLMRIRPWVILVEAVKPLSQEKDYMAWEELLTNQGYTFVYFDGLNRFYVPMERNELLPSFSVPPNIFDDFIQVSEWNTQTSLKNNEEMHEQFEKALKDKEIERQQLRVALNDKENEYLQLEAMLQLNQESTKKANKSFEELKQSAATRQRELQNHVSVLEKKLSAVDMDLSSLKIELQSVYASSSWKISKPIRSTKNILKRISWNSKFLLKKLLGKIILFLRTKPKFKVKVVALLAKIPIMDRLVLHISRSVLEVPKKELDSGSQHHHSVLLGRDFGKNLHLATNEWQLGERVDDK